MVLNGVPRDLPAGATVADAVGVLVEGPPRGVAVAVNGEVVRRGAWAATALAAGDRVEVLTAAQGG
ncbi:MAG TPA: sulfur carrier protein ThiS [Pilimelia sp.]|nr:sulfur carrier protein ThiS [Pilimelia sp.]